MQPKESSDAARREYVRSSETQRCYVTTSEGSRLFMLFNPNVDVKHILGKVADRQNNENQGLGEIKCNNLAICMNAEAEPGCMLTDDMTLKDFARDSTSVYLYANTEKCTVAAKRPRTTSAPVEGEAPAPKNAKVASPANGALFSSSTPVEGSERHGRPNNQKEEDQADGGPEASLGSSTCVANSATFDSQESLGRGCTTAAPNRLETDSAEGVSSESESDSMEQSEVDSEEGPSSQSEVGSMDAESEGDSVEAESEGDIAESVSSESEGDSAASSQSEGSSSVAESEGDSLEVESEGAGTEAVSLVSEGSDATSPRPVVHMSHEETAGTYDCNVTQSQCVEQEAAAAAQSWSAVDAKGMFASAGTRSQVVITKLGALKHLTRCFLSDSLYGQDSPHLDLTPLQTLESLIGLELERGRFMNVDAARHLTRIAVSNAEVVSGSDCSFCSSLVDLQLKANGSISMHARGVSACTALQMLRAGRECHVYAQDQANSLSTCQSTMISRSFQLPTDMSCLTALTSLSLEFSGFKQQADFSGISMLVNLEALDLTAPGTLTISQEFGFLTKLTQLQVSNPHGMGYVHLLLDWRLLHALRELHVLSYLICDDSVLALARLKHIQCADFVHARPMSASSQVWFGFLDQLFCCIGVTGVLRMWPSSYELVG